VSQSCFALKYIIPLEKARRLQGLPADFLHDAPFTVEGKIRAIGNGVPLAMGRAVARAVKLAMGYTFDSERQQADGAA
jgi:site-specific DNA-cytosine methylase